MTGDTPTEPVRHAAQSDATACPTSAAAVQAMPGGPVWHDRLVSARAGTRPPTDPTAGPWRLARVAGLGIAAYGLAVGAHVGAGGGLPGWPASVMLTALLGVLGVAFTTRRRRLPALLGVLTAAQVVLHVILSLLEAPASSCGLVAVGHHVATSSCDPSAATTGSVAMAVPSLPMLLAHLAATAVTAWVLARGEAWLWRTLQGVPRGAGGGSNRCHATGLGTPARGGALDHSVDPARRTARAPRVAAPRYLTSLSGPSLPGPLAGDGLAPFMPRPEPSGQFPSSCPVVVCPVREDLFVCLITHHRPRSQRPS